MRPFFLAVAYATIPRHSKIGESLLKRLCTEIRSIVSDGARGTR